MAQLDVKNIGVFGINLSCGFDQTWLTLWRHEDHFDAEFFALVDDEDPIQEEPAISVELAEAVMLEVIEQAGLETWEPSYGASAPDTIPGLAWTLDIDDIDRNDSMLFSGNSGIPPRAQFDALITAFRKIRPEFTDGMECMA